MRAPEKRVFYINVGAIPPEQVEQFMQETVAKMKKTPYIDQNTGDYNLKFNMQNMTEDFYVPVRGNDSATKIDTTKGLDYDGTKDVEYIKHKMMAALKIPKPFLGYEEGVEGKSTLAGMDVRFARTVERVQRIIESELTKIALVHLYTQGFEDAELLNFDLKLQNPSMIHEQEKLELMRQQLEIAKDGMDSKLFSRNWMYDNIFQLNDEEKKKIFDEIIDDNKQEYRMETISSEGTDPATDPQPQEGEVQERKLEALAAWKVDETCLALTASRPTVSREAMRGG